MFQMQLEHTSYKNITDTASEERKTVKFITGIDMKDPFGIFSHLKDILEPILN